MVLEQTWTDYRLSPQWDKAYSTLYSRDCLAHELVKSKIFWVGFIWKTVLTMLSGMWRWAPRKQKQLCRGLLQSLQRESASGWGQYPRVGVGKQSHILDSLSRKSTFLWIYFLLSVPRSSKAGVTGCRSSSRPWWRLVSTGTLSFSKDVPLVCFHWLLFGWAGPVYPSLVLFMISVLKFLKGYLVFTWTGWLHTQTVIKGI